MSTTLALIFARYIPPHCARRKALAMAEEAKIATRRSQTLYIQSQTNPKSQKEEWIVCKAIVNRNDPSVAIATSMGAEIAEIDLTNAWPVTV